MGGASLTFSPFERLGRNQGLSPPSPPLVFLLALLCPAWLVQMVDPVAAFCVLSQAGQPWTVSSAWRAEGGFLNVLFVLGCFADAGEASPVIPACRVFFLFLFFFLGGSCVFGEVWSHAFVFL